MVHARCRRRSCLSQFLIGSRYANGKGVPQDDKLAVKWHTRAAENGQAGSQLELSKMYEQGKGIPQDNVYALMWRKIVASSGGVKEARETNALLEKINETSSNRTSSRSSPRNVSARNTKDVQNKPYSRYSQSYSSSGSQLFLLHAISWQEFNYDLPQ